MIKLIAGVETKLEFVGIITFGSFSKRLGNTKRGLFKAFSINVLAKTLQKNFHSILDSYSLRLVLKSQIKAIKFHSILNLFIEMFLIQSAHWQTTNTTNYTNPRSQKIKTKPKKEFTESNSHQ